MVRLLLPGWAAMPAPIFWGSQGTLSHSAQAQWRAGLGRLHRVFLLLLITSKAKPGLGEAQTLQKSNGERVWESRTALVGGNRICMYREGGEAPSSPIGLHN